MAPFRTPRPVEEAVEACRKDAMQRIAGKKLGGSLEVHLRLGVDPRRGDEVVRGAAVLPHGSGAQFCSENSAIRVSVALNRPYH